MIVIARFWRRWSVYCPSWARTLQGRVVVDQRFFHLLFHGLWRAPGTIRTYDRQLKVLETTYYFVQDHARTVTLCIGEQEVSAA